MTKPSKDWCSDKTSGETPPLAQANKLPAKPAKLPARVQASQRTWVTEMPKASARTGASRLARKVKPNGARRRRQRPALANTASVKANR